MSLKEELLPRAQAYAQQQHLLLGDELGAGVHGIVFATRSQPEKGGATGGSAIKIHRHQADYCRERDVYLRLRDHAVTTIRGCHVPELLRHDDQLWVIEMTIVKRPFVLDFAGVFLDQAPDFSDEILAEWRAEKQEQFEQHWPEVQAILRALQAHGVFMIDVSPGNISLAN